MTLERSFIQRIREANRGQAADLVTVIGDDCAVIRKNEQDVQLLTTDTLVEGVHFDLAFHSPYDLGRKVAAVNISDIAAMGGTPRFAQLSVALSPSLDSQALDSFMTGFLKICQEHGVILTGGDTVSAPCATFTVTLLGEMRASQVIYRNQGQVGDDVWVSGTLGGAAAGLALLQKGLGLDPHFSALYKAHLDPQPQVALGQYLAGSCLVHAMQDISDGVATDLAHLCTASGLAAEIDPDLLPMPEGLATAAQLCAVEPQHWALSGGEDYQLLFALAPASGAEVSRGAAKNGLNLTRIGRLQAGTGVRLVNGQEISYQGYEHGAA